MKKKAIILTILALVFSLVFSSCGLINGDKVVSKLTIVDGTFSYEYEVGSTPDLSKIKVQADYNDGSSKVVGKDELEISNIDTATAGTKTITIKYGDITISVDVKVVANQNVEPEVTLTGISIDTSSISTRVIKGSTFDNSGIKVIASYSNNTTKNIAATELSNVGTVDTSTAGEKTLTVTYGGKNATATINVVEVTAIQIVGTTGITVMQGGSISTDGITAFATYSDNVIEPVATAELTFDIPSTAEAGAKVINVTYRGISATIPVTVKAPATVIGIEVDYNSIKDYTVVADGVALNMDAIEENIIVYAVWGYNEGGTTQIERKEAITDKALITITETNETERYITVAYGTFAQKISISETAPVVTGISIIAYNSSVKIGKVYDHSVIKITVTYSNGGSKDVSYGAAGLTASAVSTDTEGEVALTVSYEGSTDSKPVTVWGVTSIVPVGTVNTVIKGDPVSFAALSFLVTYDDNDTETIPYSAVSISNADTSEIGNHTARVTYFDGEGTIPYTVKGVKSVSIGAITTNYEVGTPFSYAGINITVTYTDDSTETFNEANAEAAGFIFNTAGISSSKVGSYDFTVTYKGVTSTAVKIIYKEVGYVILGVSEPESITALATNKNYYNNQGYGYVVGDDNPFRYSLVLSAYDFAGKKITVNRYVSKSLVYILEGGGDTILNEATQRLLEGDELASYVSIDEANNSFDFTEAAIGKMFKIVTRPAYGLEPDEYDEFTRTHIFTVVDAYNVYEARQLHVMTNTDDINESTETATHLEWAQSMLGAYNDIPEHINGVVLHNDIKIEPKDLPTEFFVGGDRTKNLNDYVSLYIRDLGKGDFTIYGNYYTVFSYLVPSIPDSGENNSHAQVFRFVNSAESTTFDHKEYDLRIENLYILDNDPNAPLDESSVRSRLGLIGFKIARCDAVLDNVVAERYYITLIGEYDNTELTLNEVKLYNAWQNHIFLWSNTDDLIDENDEPAANHTPLKLNVINSKITTCGGPIILSQTVAADKPCGKNSGADVYIDNNTEISTYVTADSVWFNVMKATPYATKILTLNAVMPNSSSYVTTTLPDGTQAEFLNMIMVSMPAGEDIDTILNGADVDGTLTVNGELVSTMDDDVTLTVNIIRRIMLSQMMGAEAVDKMDIETICSYLRDLPILQSSNGGWAYIGGSETAPQFNDLQSALAMIGIEVPAFAPGDSGYLTFYYMGMAITLDDYNSTAMTTE